MRRVPPPRSTTLPIGILLSLALLFSLPAPSRGHPSPVVQAGVAESTARQGGAEGSTTVPFERVVVDPADLGADNKAIGDLNGDGYPDLIVADNSGTPLQWYEYPSWTKRVIDPRSAFTTDMQVADVDNDGDPDIVVPDFPARQMLWYENPRPAGDAATAPWAMHAIGAGDAHDVKVGDVDGDGKIDVVVRGHVGVDPTTIVFFQDTPTSWTRTVVTTAPPGEGIALGDVDRDGDLEIAQNGYWLERPADRTSGAWTPRPFAANWPERVAAEVADMNADGRADVILAASESPGRMAWYEAPVNPLDGAWTEHVVDGSVDFVHAFAVADVNLDGHPDIAFAEMIQSARKRVGVYYGRDLGRGWTLQVLASTASHNIKVGDIDSDGDVDIFGVNYGLPARSPAELWRNELSPGRAAAVGGPAAAGGVAPDGAAVRPAGVGEWTYINADNGRAPSDRGGGAFGLAIGDVTGDGYQDVASGQYFYRNPGGTMAGPWPRVDLPNPNPANGPVDAVLLVDADGDGRLDIIAENLPDVYWMKSADAQGSAWAATRIGSIPRTDHRNGQGYELAQVVPGGPPEILLSGGDGIYAFQIPPDPSAGSWPVTRITTAAREQQGIGVGDVNADGLIDVAAWTGTPDSLEIGWWLNPGTGAGDWTRFPVGSTLNPVDRVEIADINGDGRPDVIASEEVGDPGSPMANVFWFEAPLYPTTPTWVRHPVATGFSTNSLDVADVNRDGRPDIVTGEIFGTKKTTVWVNGGAGASWEARAVDAGKESHLGARAADLDGDGDVDLISIAYQAYRDLHVWRQDAPR